MKRHDGRFLMILLAVLWLLAPPVQAQDEEPEPELEKEWNAFQVNEDLSLSLNGYLYIYHIRNHNCYYMNTDASFTEISMGLGLDFHFKDEFTGQVRVVGTGLFGRPENYLGVEPQDMETLFDLANVTWHTQACERGLNITAGLQELMYGDGFLIMDGYSETRAIWTTPIRSFPALKASLDLSNDVGEGSFFDLFTATIREDYQTFETYLETGRSFDTGGSLTGLDLHLHDSCAGSIDVGIFYKDERSSSATGSDTLAVSLRDEVDLSPFTVSGEVVHQYGQTRVNNGVPTTHSVTRQAWGGNLTCRYTIYEEGLKPYVQGRYVYFGGDRPSTGSRSEAFDPMFFGWNDWGEWWIGDMTSFEVPHSNSRVYNLEAGLSLSEFSTLRLLYFNTRLNKATSFSNTKAWSHEFNVVFDYSFSDHVFAGVMGGAAIPQSAAERFNGDDKINYEAITWIGFVF